MASSTDYYPHQTNHNYQSSHTYSVHSIATYQLPCKSKKDNEVLKVENDSFVYLSEKRVINWCNAVDTLYPIKTPGKWFKQLARNNYILIIRLKIWQNIPLVFKRKSPLCDHVNDWYSAELSI
jgi:hypothetical protein